MSELLDQVPHITLVDLIHSALDVRAPAALSAAMDVIYFLEPSEESLVVALDDHHHDGMPPAYGGAVHFVFTRRLPDELLELIRSSPVLARVATLRELNLQFQPLRSSAFSLDSPSALASLYGPSNSQERQGELGTLAEQVCTYYTSLEPSRMPRVRFAAQGHPVCRAFAERSKKVASARPRSNWPR